MDYTLSLTRHAAETLQDHLLGDHRREQMAITLCGVNKLHRELRLLVRDVILLPPDAFRQQTAARLELKSEVQAFIHQRAHQHGLIQVDWHSHPGRGSYLSFSPIDDRHEAAQAAYLAHRMDGVPYGSIVVNDDALDARLWIAKTGKPSSDNGEGNAITYRPQAYPMQDILSGDLERRIPATTRRLNRAHAAALSPTFDRQVRAFGQAFQRKLGSLRVGLVGVGGLGSALADHLGRLGVRDWVLVDPDVVELTNLNRLVNATLTDAQKGRPKVNVARSTIRQSNPKARVRALQTDVFDPEAQRALKACDLLIVATDNHSSRMAVNRLAVQYLIPLVHVGFNISVDTEKGGRTREKGLRASEDGFRSPISALYSPSSRHVTDVSGEFAIPDLGRWCLQCAGIVDPQQAGWELAPTAQRAILRQQGYVVDTPAPAVRHLDGIVASLAATEIHNLVWAFKPQQRYLAYDALRTELVPLQVTPSDSCPVCSPDHGVLGLGDLEPLPDYRRASQIQLPSPDLAHPAVAGLPSTSLRTCLTEPPLPTAAVADLPTEPSLPTAAVADLPTEPSLPTAAVAGLLTEPPPTGQAGESYQLATPRPADPPDRRARVRQLQAALNESEPDWL